MKKLKHAMPTVLGIFSLVVTGSFVTYYFVKDINNSKISQNESNISQNSSLISTNKKGINQNDKNILEKTGENKNQIQQNLSSIESNKNQIDKSKSQIDKNKNQIDKNISSIQNNKNQIDKNSSSIQNNRNQIEQKYNDLNQKIQSNSEKSESQTNQINESLKDIYTKSETEEKIRLEIEKEKGNITTSESSDSESVVVYTKSETDKLIESKNNDLKSQLNSNVDNKVDSLKNELNSNVDGKISSLKGELNSNVENKISGLKNELNSSVNSKVDDLKNRLNSKAQSSDVYTKNQVDSKKVKFRIIESHEKEIPKKRISNNSQMSLENPTSFAGGATLPQDKGTIISSYLKVTVEDVEYLIEWNGFFSNSKAISHVTQLHYKSGQYSTIGTIKAYIDNFNTVRITFNGVTVYNSSDWTPESLKYKFIFKVTTFG